MVSAITTCISASSDGDFREVSEVYLHREPVDLRKAIDRLYSIVALEMKLVAFSGAMIVFCNHTRNQLKIIYWD